MPQWYVLLPLLEWISSKIAAAKARAAREAQTLRDLATRAAIAFRNLRD